MTEKEVIESVELLNHKLKNQLHAVGINLDVLKTKLKKHAPGEKDMIKHLDLAANQAQLINNIILEFVKYMKLDDKKRAKKDLRKILEGVIK